jgi:8-oxo-dGTP pyrophosphatase MutT (NUDIX family)
MLRSGAVRFVSFSARNFGLMLLRLLARQNLERDSLITNEGLWRGSQPERIRERREWLRGVGERLLASGEDAPVIRHSHVSAALIKFGQHFLCVTRGLSEDDPDSERGTLVLPGGRVAPSDCPGDMPVAERIRLAGSPSLGLYSDVIHERCLERELFEELGLPKTMYGAKLFSELPPFKGLFGSGDSYSLTETNIRLYTLTLDAKSAVVMHRHFSMGHKSRWFTAEELLAQRNAQNERVFFQAGSQMLALRELHEAPGCFPFIEDSEGKFVCLSRWGEDSGVTLGKEIAGTRATEVFHALTEQQVGALALLAVARRSFSPPFGQSEVEPMFQMCVQDVAKLEQAMAGVVVRDPGLRDVLISLPRCVANVIYREDDYFQIRPLPYFDPRLFSYHLDTQTGRLCLHRQVLRFPEWGVECPGKEVGIRLVGRCWDMLSNSISLDYNVWRDAKDRITKEDCQSMVTRLGLRQFIGIKDKSVVIHVNQKLG